MCLCLCFLSYFHLVLSFFLSFFLFFFLSLSFSLFDFLCLCVSIFSFLDILFLFVLYVCRFSFFFDISLSLSLALSFLNSFISVAFSSASALSLSLSRSLFSLSLPQLLYCMHATVNKWRYLIFYSNLVAKKNTCEQCQYNSWTSCSEAQLGPHPFLLPVWVWCLVGHTPKRAPVRLRFPFKATPQMVRTSSTNDAPTRGHLLGLHHSKVPVSAAAKHAEAQFLRSRMRHGRERGVPRCLPNWLASFANPNGAVLVLVHFDLPVVPEAVWNQREGCYLFLKCHEFNGQGSDRLKRQKLFPRTSKNPLLFFCYHC